MTEMPPSDLPKPPAVPPGTVVCFHCLFPPTWFESKVQTVDGKLVPMRIKYTSPIVKHGRDAEGKKVYVHTVCKKAAAPAPFPA